GTTVLAAAHTYTGSTTVNRGALVINGSIKSPTTVNASGTLSGTGTILNDVVNAGAVAPGSDAANIGTLTIDGRFTSNGGTLAIDAKLGGDSSPADRLRITGDTIMGSGPTRVVVTNVDGTGAETTGDGIRIVQVGGTSAPNLFVLDAPVTVGKSVYHLFQGGIADPNDGNWYLRAAGPAHEPGGQ
ncbi:MAG: autotransporter outer membrane beta-barrel domain-containing protein, partial [Vicinamibacteraceae bacterium]